LPRISKSSLLERMGCPFAWYCNRVLKMPGKDSLGMIVGTSFHEAEEWFQSERMANRVHSLEECKRQCRAVFNGKVRESWKANLLEASREQVNEARGQVLGLVEVFHPYALGLKPVAVEQEFSISLPGLPEWSIFGYIDAICEAEDAPGQHVVVDYKTAASSPYKEDGKDPKGTDERRLNYVSEVLWNPEVACYCLGYRALFGKREHEFMYYYAVKTKKPKVMPVRVKVTDDQIDWFLKLAVDYVRGIMTDIHERRTDGWSCSPKGCSYWDFCHGILDKPKRAGQLIVV